MYSLKKKNKRLLIIDNEENIIYSPPNFLRGYNNVNLQQLCDKFNDLTYRDLDSIIEFETKFRHKKNEFTR
jgi:hypothetical protein